MFALSFVATVCLYATSAHGFKAFMPNCTTPPDHVTWVSPPAVRGTMDIIFSCFSVLLICTWAIQHLSVPPHKHHSEHSWNRRFVRNLQYSAFLDDLRFNFTKLKWMGLSVLAPEYILSKALSEFLAAHDSRRQFGREEWTTTHGYFANMRGFILRFDVAAVPTSLEPTKPDKLGRAKFRPNPNRDPPYFPQDPFEAEAEELEQCHRICGRPCKNRPDADTEVDDGFGSGPMAQYGAPTSMHSHSRGLPGSEFEYENKTEATIMGMSNLLATPTYLAGRRSAELMALSPSTLVNPSPVSFVNRHPLPMNANPTTIVVDNKMALETSATSMSPESAHNNRSPEQIKPLSPQEEYPPTTPSIASNKIERLGFHKTWKATWALSSMQMLYAYNSGIIPLPNVSAEDLNDRSKGDALVKGLAILQIIWLVIQMITRASQNLAITQLEISVLALAVCALFTYILLLHKPQDVKVPSYIDIPGTLSREQVIQIAARSPVATLMIDQYWLHGVAIRSMADNVFPWTRGIRIHIPYIMKEAVFLNPHFVGLGGGGALFGGVHLAAWNFRFPTSVERLLWRISCTYLVAFPLVGTLIYVVVLHYARKEKVMTEGRMDKMLRPMGWVTIPIYLLARLYLLVEIFRCLAYPPPNVFVNVSWPSIIPHLS